MRSPRCGVVDIEADQTPGDWTRSSRDGGRRHKRYSFPRRADGSPLRWDTPELTWALQNPSQQLSENEQKQVMKEALRIWAEVVPITFREERRPGEEPDIVIKFASGRHGPSHDPVFDGSPQDRPNILAHAWGPNPNPKGIAGDVHFDAQDRWSRDFLLAVAVHELGHTMGLHHSNDQTAIMYPLYQTSVELAVDDIRGIKDMYGSGIKPATARPTATRSPEVRTDPMTRRPPVTRLPGYRTLQPTWKPTPPFQDNRCTRVDVEAIFADPSVNSGRYFAVSGEQVHQLSIDGQVLKSEELSVVFPGVPQKTDVAFSLKGNVYFIKGFKLWAYRNNQLQSGYPITLESGTLPETPKFAVLYKDGQGRDRPLLFGRSKWWTFTEHGSPHGIDISDFAGPLPDNVVFGAQWSDGLVYVVTRNSYIKIDQANRKIMDDEPIPGMPDWLSELCSTGSRTPNGGYERGGYEPGGDEQGGDEQGGNEQVNRELMNREAMNSKAMNREPMNREVMNRETRTERQRAESQHTER
ncbi:hypothetical protein Btru_018956 [Bulinus truncatus]|nr:hypothetical protein Btru_018956 [Bulinus truncatus]